MGELQHGMNTMDLRTLLIEFALQEGFSLASTVDIELAFSSPSNTSIPTTLHPSIKRYEQWIQSGYAGSMEYLVRGQPARANPRLLFPATQSLLCVALPYPRNPAGEMLFSEGARYARYLQGTDYHVEIRQKLERVMTQVHRQWSEAHPEPQLTWKICVDTSAVLERSWAALAGLGWIGKNSLLIHPKQGSYLFLAEVLLSQKTGSPPQPLPNYCGNCSRCLKACPTQSFQDSQMLDSNRCISYLTLEKRGRLEICEKDRIRVGPWIAGCDVCQEVCPFNLKPVATETSRCATTHDATQLKKWTELLLENQDQYRLRVKHSAMNRIKPAQFSRNLAVSFSNFLINLDRNCSKELVLTLASAIENRLQGEQDESAKNEWIRCSKLIKLFE